MCDPRVLHSCACIYGVLPYAFTFAYLTLCISYNKPTRCTNFSNLFLEWNSACFGRFLCPSSGVFYCTHTNCICHTGLLTLLCVEWKTPDDGQRNCPKHIKSHSPEKFEKLVQQVGFIIRNLTRCTVAWTSNNSLYFPALRYIRMHVILNPTCTPVYVLDTEEDGSTVTFLTSIPKAPSSNFG
jgi:hypothetical protein